MVVRLLLGLVFVCGGCGATAHQGGGASGGEAGAGGSAGEAGGSAEVPPRADCCPGERIIEEDYVGAVASACTLEVTEPMFAPWPGPWSWWQAELVPHPYAPGVVYALPEDQEAVQPSSLFASVDGGLTFCPLAAPSRLAWLVLAAADARVLYAGDDLGALHVSTDAGATWQTRQMQGFAQPVNVHPSAAERLLVAGELTFEQGEVRATFQSSDDGGRSWQTHQGPLVGIDAVSALIAHDPVRSDRLYAVGVSSQATPLSEPKLAVSDDAGQTWREAALPEGAETPAQLGVAGDGRVFVLDFAERLWSADAEATTFERSTVPDFAPSSWVLSMHAPPTAPTGAVYLAGTGPDGAQVAKTTDGGRTWLDLAVPTDVGNSSAPVLAREGNVYMSAPVGLRYSADDGASWQAGYTVPHGALVTSPDGTTLLATERDAVFRSFDAGTTWSASASGVSGGNAFPAIAPDEPSTFYLGAFPPSGTSKLLRSDDSGETWSDSGVMPTGAETLLVAAEGMLFSHLRIENDTWLARSTDRGVTWDDVLANVGWPTRSVDGSRVYVAQEDGDSCRDVGNDCRSDLLFFSDDLGESWQFAAVGYELGLETGVVRAIAADARDPDVVYVLLVAGRFLMPEPTQTSVLVSRDGGASYALFASLEGISAPAAPVLLATLSQLYLVPDWHGALLEHDLNGGSWNEIASTTPGGALLRASDDSLLLPSMGGFLRYVP